MAAKKKPERVYIRMRSIYAGPMGVRKPDWSGWVDSAEGEALVRGRFADMATPPEQQAAAKPKPRRGRPRTAEAPRQRTAEQPPATPPATPEPPPQPKM